MLKTTAIVVVVLIAAILIYAATKPDSFRMQRTTTIQSPPDKIVALLIDLRGWSSWSPYEKRDPAMKRTLSGAPQGKGAVCEWKGNNAVGQGRMEILESLPASKILIKLDFLKPFEAHNFAEFILEGNGDSTNVTWAMFGPAAYMTKVISLFMDCDKMVGPQFETGLANMKAVTEK